jgi:hypothetical protein
MAAHPERSRLSVPPRALRMLQGLGALWTLPNSALGLLAGLVGMFAGARPYWSGPECALVFRDFPWGPGGAITLGNVILHTGPTLEVRCHTYAHQAGWCCEPVIGLRAHERAHVYQYLVLGPFYLPVYLLCGGVSARNPFERAADVYALTGRGWWPSASSRR